jgi:hypothetical protein
MPTFSKELLSESTNGRPIKVAQTATAGTIIHTASSTSGVIDEVWLYAHNTGANTVALTVEFGGTSNPDDRIIVGLPPVGTPELILVCPGLPLNGGVSVRAFAGEANVANIVGYVNRIAP